MTLRAGSPIPGGSGDGSIRMMTGTDGPALRVRSRGEGAAARRHPKPGGRYLLQRASVPGSGLPIRATGMKKHIWPIATVSVQSAL